MLTIRIPKFNAEHFFGMFLVLFWGQDILFSYIRAILILIPYIKYTAEYVIPALMFMCLLCALPYFIKVISYKDILFTLAVAIVFCLHILIYPENESTMSIFGTFITAAFPLYFIGLRFDVSKHWRLLYILSIINIWFFIIYIFSNDNTATSGQAMLSSYMHRAYVLLPQLLVVIVELFKKANPLNVLTVIAGIVILMMCGNRGSVLLLFLFILFCILFISEKKRNIGIYAGIISVFAVAIYYFKSLSDVLMMLFSRFGMSSRVLARLSEGTFFTSSGRDIITKKLWTAILEKPILGYGLTSDRTFVESYAHNFAFELWMSFGLIAGTILLIVIAYIVVKSLVKTKEKTSKAFLFMLICIGLLKLFISSSFLEEGLFFMMLGACVAFLRQNRLGMSKERGRIYESL